MAGIPLEFLSHIVLSADFSGAALLQDLKDFIRNHGLDVKTVDVLAGPDGRSKGCALVEFMDSSSAQQAINMLNNVDFMGRQMFVREDREEANKIRIDR